MHVPALPVGCQPRQGRAADPNKYLVNEWLSRGKESIASLSANTLHRPGAEDIHVKFRAVRAGILPRESTSHRREALGEQEAQESAPGAKAASSGL